MVTQNKYIAHRTEIILLNQAPASAQISITVDKESPVNVLRPILRVLNKEPAYGWPSVSLTNYEAFIKSNEMFLLVFWCAVSWGTSLDKTLPIADLCQMYCSIVDLVHEIDCTRTSVIRSPEPGFVEQTEKVSALPINWTSGENGELQVEWNKNVWHEVCARLSYALKDEFWISKFLVN